MPLTEDQMLREPSVQVMCRDRQIWRVSVPRERAKDHNLPEVCLDQRARCSSARLPRALIFSYLVRLEADSKRLRRVTGIAPQNPTPESEHSTPFDDSNGEDDAPRLSREESILFNPLFDKQPQKPVQERSSEPGFIGEASCAAFSNRLLQCLDDTYTPSTAGLSNYHRLSSDQRLPTDQGHEFPERMHVKLLLNVARRFIGNYHPLFLEVTFMKEIDAVYRRELIPSTLWLCKFYALVALGDIYARRRVVGDNNRVPGTNYYVKAVDLLQENQDYYEEPSLMQVEVLTLLVRGFLLQPFLDAKTRYRHGHPTSSVASGPHTATAASLRDLH